MEETSKIPESSDTIQGHKMHHSASPPPRQGTGIEHRMHKKGEPGKAHRGHSGWHEGHTTEDFKRRFIISLILTFPILALSTFIQELFRFRLEFPGSIYILFLLSTFVYCYGGYPFLKGLFREVKENNIGMMTLIGTAISAAYFYSTAVVFGLKGEVFFWELATLIDIMLLGHWIEMRSVLGASRALEELVKIMPSEAHFMRHRLRPVCIELGF